MTGLKVSFSSTPSMFTAIRRICRKTMGPPQVDRVRAARARRPVMSRDEPRRRAPRDRHRANGKPVERFLSTRKKHVLAPDGRPGGQTAPPYRVTCRRPGESRRTMTALKGRTALVTGAGRG